MKLYSSVVFRWVEGATPVQLAAVYETSSFGWLQRSSAREVFLFVSREVVQRLKVNQRESVSHKGHLCHAYVRSDGLACAVVTDEEYPQRVAFGMISKTLEAFLREHEATWQSFNKDTTLAVTGLESLLTQFQDPTEADKLLKIQKDLDETKEVIITTIDKLLERGERLETLAQRSEDLSFQSKAFMDKSDSMNSCCVLV